MKHLRVLLLVVISLSFGACDKDNGGDLGGTEVTQQFLNDYNGIFLEQMSETTGEGERISINRDGDIEVLKLRQVGSKNDPAVPKPTICSFILSGQIRYITQLDEESRERVDANDLVYLIPQTHNLTFSVHQVSLTNELHEGSTSNQACLNFQERMNQKLPVYTYGMELFGEGTFRLHTSDIDGYQGGERSTSNLDEVFKRE